MYTPHRQDSMDNTPPYVAYGHCGQPIKISYTEEVVGSASKAHSSPIPPTHDPQGWGFCVNNTYMWGFIGCPDSPGVKSGATVCNWVQFRYYGEGGCSGFACPSGFAMISLCFTI
jgi:hypothetical protein